MPLSMRRQSLIIKKRRLASQERAKKRAHALQLIQKGFGSIRSIAEITLVPRSTVSDLKQYHQAKNKEAIEKMLSEDTKAGTNTILTPEEEKIVVKRLLFVASRGAAVGYDALRCMMAKVASDGRKQYKKTVPSNEAIRAFRARHRELTFRSHENKEAAKLRAERELHIKPFFDIIAEIGRRHPGLLNNPNRIWNLDETAVDATYGKKRKVFTSSKSHHGGYQSCSTNYASQKHITAVVCVSASGLKTPPFFIVQGKRINERWFDSIKGSFDGPVGGICGRYVVPDWFPASSAVIKMTDKGSMEMDVLKAAVAHIARYMRNTVGGDTVLLTLDGHSSRNGTGWIEECKENNIEAVIAPANTSHLVQPCDQFVNKKFKGAMRELRDGFCGAGLVDTRKVNVNLACGLHGFEQISTDDMTKSFEVTGLFPFNANFAERFRTAAEHAKRNSSVQLLRLKDAGPRTRLNSVIKRHCDADTYSKMCEIFASSDGPSTAIQRVACVLAKAKTVNDIVMAESSIRTASTSTSERDAPMVLHDAGAQAECVTLDTVFARRRSVESKRAEEEAQKNLRRIAEATARERRKEEAADHQQRVIVQRERRRQAAKDSLLEKKRLKVIREDANRLGKKVARGGYLGICGTKGTGGGRKRKVRSCQFGAMLVLEVLDEATRG